MNEKTFTLKTLLAVWLGLDNLANTEDCCNLINHLFDIKENRATPQNYHYAQPLAAYSCTNVIVNHGGLYVKWAHKSDFFHFLRHNFMSSDLRLFYAPIQEREQAAKLFLEMHGDADVIVTHYECEPVLQRELFELLKKSSETGILHMPLNSDRLSIQEAISAALHLCRVYHQTFGQPVHIFTYADRVDLTITPESTAEEIYADWQQKKTCYTIDAKNDVVDLKRLGISKFPSLTHLTISCSSVLGFSELLKLPHLTRLNLIMTECVCGFEKIPSHPKLKEIFLTLNGLELTDILEPFEQSLDWVAIADCSLQTPFQLSKTGYIKLLKLINIAHPEHLLPCGLSLKKLFIYENRHIKIETLRQALQTIDCKNLNLEHFTTEAEATMMESLGTKVTVQKRPVDLFEFLLMFLGFAGSEHIECQDQDIADKLNWVLGKACVTEENLKFARPLAAMHIFGSDSYQWLNECETCLPLRDLVSDGCNQPAEFRQKLATEIAAQYGLNTQVLLVDDTENHFRDQDKTAFFAALERANREQVLCLTHTPVPRDNVIDREGNVIDNVCEMSQKACCYQQAFGVPVCIEATMLGKSYRVTDQTTYEDILAMHNA